MQFQRLTTLTIRVLSYAARGILPHQALFLVLKASTTVNTVKLKLGFRVRIPYWIGSRGLQLHPYLLVPFRSHGQSLERPSSTSKAIGHLPNLLTRLFRQFPKLVSQIMCSSQS